MALLALGGITLLAYPLFSIDQFWLLMGGLAAEDAPVLRMLVAAQVHQVGLGRIRDEGKRGVVALHEGEALHIEGLGGPVVV